jgi:hypothetical protein
MAVLRDIVRTPWALSTNKPDIMGFSVADAEIPCIVLRRRDTQGPA